MRKGSWGPGSGHRDGWSHEWEVAGTRRGPWRGAFWTKVGSDLTIPQLLSSMRSTQTGSSLSQLPQPTPAVPASEPTQRPGDSAQCTGPAGETASSSQAALIPGARTQYSLTREIQKVEPPQKSSLQIHRLLVHKWHGIAWGVLGGDTQCGQFTAACCAAH